MAEMGVIGALFDESDGGYGGAGFDVALVFEELGRVGAVDPLLDTAVLCGGVLAGLGNDEQKTLIEPIIEGSLQMAMAHAEPQSRYELTRVETRPTRDGSAYQLSGQKSVVVNAFAADYFIVSARSDGDVASQAGISLFLVPAGAEGLMIRDYPLISGGRAAEVLLENVRVDDTALLAGGRGGGKIFPNLTICAVKSLLVGRWVATCHLVSTYRCCRSLSRVNVSSIHFA